MVSIITKIKGVQVGDAQRNIKELMRKRKSVPKEERKQPSLVREPTNPFDPNAIKVEIDGLYLGYIPRKTASNLAPRIDDGMQYSVSSSWVNRSPGHEVVGMTLEISEVSSNPLGDHATPTDLM
ncbi:MAG: hypothetical protein C4576_30645 [Desulfobacteraceae bacterium]|nr:MAG: hypothetical protein C4576_30645 [Desulfobacteraceae bacterium]